MKSGHLHLDHSSTHFFRNSRHEIIWFVDSIIIQVIHTTQKRILQPKFFSTGKARAFSGACLSPVNQSKFRWSLSRDVCALPIFFISGMINFKKNWDFTYSLTMCKSSRFPTFDFTTDRAGREIDEKTTHRFTKFSGEFTSISSSQVPEPDQKTIEPYSL